MTNMGHGIELIQLNSNVAQKYQSRLNQFKDGFLGKSWWAGFKARYLEIVLQTTEGLDG